ncbi:MAG: hypothetical protein K2G08_09950 [Paramuribaculum sp.]|nr:hypothetical protein [Bacteroides sp.]MDE6051993.1 hypothetical protein [Paramuribaculum sp.]
MMKKILSILLLFSALIAFAGTKKLSDGTIVFWPEKTEVVKYGCCRVEVKLTEPSSQNILGSVKLECFGKTFMPDNNLFIPAGEMKGYVDFSNLDDGCSYKIRVTLKNQ